MRVLAITILTLMLGLAGITTTVSATGDTIPDYAKWGIVAVKETQTKYNVDILDYKHIGRSSLSASESREQFKLWVRAKDGKQFAVYVHVDFNPNTQQLKKYNFPNLIAANRLEKWRTRCLFLTEQVWFFILLNSFLLLNKELMFAYNNEYKQMFLLEG